MVGGGVEVALLLGQRGVVRAIRWNESWLVAPARALHRVGPLGQPGAGTSKLPTR